MYFVQKKTNFTVYIFLTLISMLILNCGITKYPEKIDFTLDLSNNDNENLIANGVQTTTFTVKIPKDASTKSIMLKTNYGQFLSIENKQEISIKAEEVEDNDTALVATAVLRVETLPGVGLVSAKVDDIEKLISISVDTAFASSLMGETSSGFVDSAGTTIATIRAHLKRNVGEGNVSQGIKVKFNAFQINAALDTIYGMGRFTNFGIGISDSSSVAAVNYAADTGDVTIGERIFITMTTKAKLGKPLTDTISVLAR